MLLFSTVSQSIYSEFLNAVTENEIRAESARIAGPGPRWPDGCGLHARDAGTDSEAVPGTDSSRAQTSRSAAKPPGPWGRVFIDTTGTGYMRVVDHTDV